MSVSRAQFLKSLGASVSNLALGTGIASAAQAIAKVSAAPPAPKTAPFDPAKIRIPTSGSGSDNQIALTFDDGPTPSVTEVILDELKQRRLRATFFMIGERVVAAPEVARRVHAEGHEIGNHTFRHRKLTTLPDAQVADEIQKTQDTLGELLNVRPAWLRPPYGAFRKNQIGIPQSKNLGVVLWSADSRDWAQPGEEKIIETILCQTKAGSIILCHDLHPQTANCLGKVLDSLLERNFKFVNVSSIFKDDAALY